MAGDIQDTLDNDNEVSMNIVVTGYETIGEQSGSGNGSGSGNQESYAPDSVYTRAQTSGTIKRWDKVDYDAGSLTTEGMQLPSGASVDDTISAEDSGNWVVLNVDNETGEVTIIPTTFSSNTLTLEGLDGYNNAITKTVQGSTIIGAIDRVASIYLNPDYAVSSRGLTVNDVNNIEVYNPDEDVSQDTFDGDYPDWNQVIYNGSKTYNPMRYDMDEKFDVVDGQTRGSRTYSVTPSTVDYGYETQIMKNYITECWLASRSWHLYDDYCMLYVRCLCVSFYNGKKYMGNEYLVGTNVYYPGYSGEDDDIEEISSSNYVVPVVTLKPNVHMNKDGDTWKLSL